MKHSAATQSDANSLADMVDILCTTAKKGLNFCYADPAALPYTIRYNGNDTLALNGFSIRYAAMAQIGIMHWLENHPENSNELPDLWPRISDIADSITHVGDFALALWAGLVSKADNLETFAQALQQSWYLQADTCNAVELAWVLQACLIDLQHHEYHRLKLKSIREDACRRLLSLFDEDSDLFYRHNRSGIVEYVSRRISCFADQVYPIMALANYAKLSGDQRCTAIVARASRRICDYQGDLGQWWWHYDVPGNKICEEFPVFSVHQDAMAPMALKACATTTDNNFDEEIERGIRWLFESNELDEGLVCEPEGMIWRDIERKEPQKMSRNLRGLCCVANMRKLHQYLGRWYQSFKINRECRPYHLGWILFAWADFAPDQAKEGNDCNEPVE